MILRNLKNIFLVSELRRKVLFTLGALVVERFGTFIPIIGVNVEAMRKGAEATGGLAGLLNYLDMMSGGALRHGTIFALGILPYITASIMVQMLGIAVPSLEQLMKEGEYGRKIINQYTRYLTLGLSLMYGLSFSLILERQGFALTPGFGFKIVCMISLAVGAMLVMWLAEQISLYGIGNGSSIIIFSGIVCRFPSYANRVAAKVSVGDMHIVLAFGILAAFVVITGLIVFLEMSDRKIPVQYARRVIGHRMYGGQSSYIPFKINPVGVMPVIFASSFLQFPVMIGYFVSTRFKAFGALAESLSGGGVLYNVFEFLLIIFFSYFYTSIVFNPVELADNIKKSGGFIPGVRPGKRTADFFDYILTRIGLIGAIYLATLALMPSIMKVFFDMPFMIQGTSLLIAVGVALEISTRVDSYLVEHRYEGLLSTGRIRGRVR